MKFILPLAAIVVCVVVGSAVYMTTYGQNNDSTTNSAANNVIIENGKQIIEIKAKGGYQPRTTVAAAGIPTTIRFVTAGTFDCSSSISIPRLNIDTNLPSSGKTDIDVGSVQAGLLQGTCGMGMYPFEIEFQG